MSKPQKKPLVPALRFSEFRDAEDWKKTNLAEFLTESRILGNKASPYTQVGKTLKNQQLAIFIKLLI